MLQLKGRMTYEEMAAHMQEHSLKIPSRVTVGKYARENGYSVYKPMIDGKIMFFYVNEKFLNKENQ